MSEYFNIEDPRDLDGEPDPESGNEMDSVRVIELSKKSLSLIIQDGVATLYYPASGNTLKIELLDCGSEVQWMWAIQEELCLAVLGRETP